MRDPLRKAFIAWVLCLGVVGVASPSAVGAQVSEPIADAPKPAPDQADDVPQRTADPNDDVAPPASEPEQTGDVSLRTANRTGGPADPESDQAAEVGEPAADGADDDAQAVSEAAVHFEDWVIASGDNGGLPFVIIDKVQAEVWVFDAAGQLQGAAPALLGFAHGDDSVPGIGDRKLSTIRPSERTTPAGRFIAGFGRTPGEENVLWVDYENAVSLHPVITASPKEKRLQRLKSATPEDNRITFGCINVPAAFYKAVVRPAFKGTTGVVYVLPETKSLDDVFPAFRSQQRAELTTPAPSTSEVESSARNVPN
jgi:hypothetical protein